MAIEPVGPVVVGVDGSPASLAALDLAGDEAAARVTPLLVVCAAQTSDAPDGAHASEILDAAVARALAEHPALSVTGELVAGDPAEGLLAALREAALGVIGRRHRTAGERPDGSVALRVLNRTQVPVIVYRTFDAAAEGDLPRPVLVGVAPGPGCDDVVGFAFAEAALRGAPLHAVYVEGGPDDGPPPDQMLAEALTAWSEKYPEVIVCQSIRRGVDAAVALTAASHSAQLAVIGAPRWVGRTEISPGSVVGAMTHRAGCPVAVVPAIVEV